MEQSKPWIECENCGHRVDTTEECEQANRLEEALEVAKAKMEQDAEIINGQFRHISEMEPILASLRVVRDFLSEKK